MNRKTFILTLMLLMLAGLSIWAQNVAKIGDTEYETLDGAFAAAQGGNTIEIIQAGTYTLPSPISNLTIKGCDGVVFNAMKEYGQSVSSLHDVAFELVKFIFGSSNYTGFQHSESVTFTKCTFEGYFNSYGTMLFDQCTFNSPEGNYSMWCYAGDVTYRNCTINCKGKFVNVYNEGNTTADRPWKVVAEGCTFNSSVKNKAALNIKATCGNTPLYYDVEIKNCTANGENWPVASTSESLVVGSALWQVDDINASVASEIKVTVDGKAVFPAPVAKIAETGYASLEKAIAAVPTNGTETTTVQMIDDITLSDKLLIDGGKKLILDLGGKTLTGRVNVSGAELTVKNGTINAGTFNQALNVYGSKDSKYKEGIFTYVKVEKDVTLDGATCALGIMSVLGETYYPLSYGVKVDFYGKATNMPAQVSGNIGFDNYKANIGNVDISANLPEGIQAPSKAMSLYGPIVNIYGEMKSSVTKGECQAFILSGMARVNVYDGATIEGSEGFAMKSGNLHVYGGTIKSNGQKINPVQAVSSGSEASGAAISITSFYTSNLFEDRAKISVVVENGEIIGGNNSALLVTHSYKDNSPVALEQGVNLAINGGKFSCGGDVPVLFIDNAATGDAFTMPSAFVSSGLFKIAPKATYLATGKTVIGNPDKTDAYPYAVVPLANEVQVAAEVEIASVEEETPLTPEEVQAKAESVVKEAIKDMAGNTEVTNLSEETQTNNNSAVAENVVGTKQSVGINVEFTGTKVSVETGTGTTTTVTLKELTFDVTPYVVETTTIGSEEKSVAVKKIENQDIKAPMTFRLPIPSSVTDNHARVIHYVSETNTEDMGLKEIKSTTDQTEQGKTYKYIEITTTSFSKFEAILTTVSVPTTLLYYYAGNATMVEGEIATPSEFQSAQEDNKNAIAFVSSEYAEWASGQTNVVVDYSVGTNDGHYYECPKFVLTDLEDFYTPVDFHVVNGSYTRENTSNLNTVCLPFKLSSTDVNNGQIGVFHSTDMYDDNGIKASGNVYFNVVENVNPGTPCIIACDENDAGWNIDLAGKTVAANPNNVNALKGSYVEETIGAGVYKVDSNGEKFGKTTYANETVVPFRAYLDLKHDDSGMGASGVKEFNIEWADDATGIENVKVASDSKVIYDLTGRMVNNPVKGGLYIINGKKVIFK